jgi:hypothetical protein
MKRFVSTMVAIGMAATAVMAQQATPPPASPRGTAAMQVGGSWADQNGEPVYRNGKWIVIDYGRPILRGRTAIFGKGADYGKKISDNEPVWRAGANQTTRLKTEVPLTIGGKTLPAGEYSLQVELKEGAWTLIVSSQPFQEKYDPNDKGKTWGNYNYDKKFDVVRVPMKLRTMDLSNEQFTIAFTNATPQGATLTMWWDTQLASVDLKF